MPKSETIDLYDSMLAAADAARASALYEVMFHALSGALHAAEAAGDVERVVEVERRGAEVRDWLAREEPQHRIATESAHRRGQTDVMTTLVVHAQSMASRLRAARAVEHARERTRVHDPAPDMNRQQDRGSRSSGEGTPSYASE